MAKQKFKITNWPAYNKVLRQRGSLTVWLDESVIAAWTDSSRLGISKILMPQEIGITVGEICYFFQHKRE